MKFIFLLLFSTASIICFGQDSSLRYTRILSADGVSKDKIYDRAMVWCGEKFISSKDAIRVTDKSSGLISGKARFEFSYMIPKKEDSTLSSIFTPFHFNWIIECKEGKLRIKVSDVEYVQIAGNVYTPEIKKVVYKNSKPPLDIFFMSSKKVQTEWDMSLKYFVIRLDQLMDNLQNKLAQSEGDW